MEGKTFEEKLAFLAKGEEDTIQDYKDFIAWCKENGHENIVESIEEIINEESAHFVFLQKAMEDPETKYVDSDKEAEEAGKLFGMNFKKEK